MKILTLLSYLKTLKGTKYEKFWREVEKFEEALPLSNPPEPEKNQSKASPQEEYANEIKHNKERCDYLKEIFKKLEAVPRAHFPELRTLDELFGGLEEDNTIVEKNGWTLVHKSKWLEYMGKKLFEYVSDIKHMKESSDYIKERFKISVEEFEEVARIHYHDVTKVVFCKEFTKEDHSKWIEDKSPTVSLIGKKYSITVTPFGLLSVGKEVEKDLEESKAKSKELERRLAKSKGAPKYELKYGGNPFLDDPFLHTKRETPKEKCDNFVVLGSEKRKTREEEEEDQEKGIAKYRIGFEDCME